MENIIRTKKITIIALIALLPLYSCEVEPIKPATPVEVDKQPINKDDESSSKPSDGERSIQKMGNGSGILKIENLKDKNIEINPGIYQSIILSNISNTLIDGLGKVSVNNGNVDISHVNKVTIRGISIENHNQAAVYIHSEANYLTLQDLKLKNIDNYGIRFEISKRYDGTPPSYSQDIHLLDIQAENIGTLFISQGNIEEDGFYGLIKGFKLRGSTVKNSPFLNGLTSLGLAENYEISNNKVTDVNASDKYPFGMNNHTAIFFARGTGKIFNNKITNHQGNAVRAWLLSITEPGSVEIYNNIVYNSTRYGAFEVQVPPSTQYLDTFKPADAKIYNNTVGKLNTGQPKFFEGRLLDLYQTFGNVEIYNNLSFELRDNILLNNMSDPTDTKVIKQVNNRYFQKHSDAVHDVVDFKSKVSGLGAQ